MSQKEKFIELLERIITEIPQDVKIVFEMLDDLEFDDDVRLRAAGTLLYLLAPGDLIPDTFGLLGHADDSLVLRMTMAHSLEKHPDRTDHYKERYPEVFDTLDEDLQTAADYFGDVYPWMKEWLQRLEKIEYKGKRASMILEDIDEGSWLIGEVNEALLDLEFDDDELNRELRRVDRILQVLQDKMTGSRR